MADAQQRYEVSGTILQLGAVTLCRAKRVADGRRVVLKVLDARLSRPQDLVRLRNEFQVGAALEPDTVVQPLELTTLGGNPALVLEDSGGEGLDRRLGTPMPVDVFLPLAVGMAGALAALHRQGVVHKDIQPGNFVVHQVTGRMKLTGLGFASILPVGQAACPPPKTIEGSLPYMAPEQTGRLNRMVDQRSDLYSLGVIFYELLAGKLPFEGKTALDWVHSHIAVAPKPPAELLPAVPGMVSDIVVKLLSKAPEDRYQGAGGLLADLEQCRQQWLIHGRINAFRLGASDLSGQFRIPHRLYGRDAEIAAIHSAYDRMVAGGRTEVLLCSGYSGIGKTSLVKELDTLVLRDRGFMLAGKFDQFKRDIPYSTIVQAFQELVRQLFSGGGIEIEQWRERIQKAVGINGVLITDVIPQVALIIGPQPPVVPLSTSDAQERFNTVFREFVCVFARPGLPLTLFLDDLQWADNASLKLLQALVTHPDTRDFLLIGAYRDNEVTPTHPLMLTVGEIRKTGTMVEDIVLRPLSLGDLGAFMADTLATDSKSVAPLAELVFQKTGGNPFFFIQFIKNLHAEGLIKYDAGKRGWIWSLEEITVRGFTDNVIDFMVGQMGKLPSSTQDVMRRFAGLGNKAKSNTLAVICETPEEQLARDMDAALQKGLVLRDQETWQFVHDRVQQASYTLLSEAERQKLHLRIGRLLSEMTADAELPERVFDIVSQYNRAAPLLEHDEERVRIAGLNLVAGEKAKTSLAYESAAQYLSHGLALLPGDAWRNHYALALGLHVGRAECMWLLGDLAGAETLFLDLLGHPELSHVDRVKVHRALLEIYTTLGRMGESIEQCQKSLALSGIDFPAAPSADRIAAEYQQYQRNLGGRAITDLINLPVDDNPETKALMDVLAAIIPAALFTNEDLLFLVTCMMVNRSMQYGNSDASASGYIYFACEIGPRFNLYKEATQFAMLAYDVVNTRGLSGHKSRVYMMMDSATNFTRHMRTSFELLSKGLDAAMEVGDMCGACYLFVHVVGNRLAVGDNLEEVQQEAEKSIEFMRKVHFTGMEDLVVSMLRSVLNLRGLTHGFHTFSDSQFDEGSFAGRVAQHPIVTIHFWYLTYRTFARYLFGDYEAAAEAGRAGSGIAWSTPSHIQVQEHLFYYTLALAAQCAQAGGNADRLKTIGEHLATFKIWAENCPENFQHKHDLIAAEIACLTGHPPEAEALYEKAIRGARENGYIQIEGLAYERAALFYRDRGFGLFADSYLREARSCYLRWGAEGKVRQLEQQYPQMGPRPLGLLGKAEFQQAVALDMERLDLGMVVKASQAISGEIVLSKLLDTLLSTAIEVAGAQRGYLLLPRGKEYQVMAEAAVVDGKIEAIAPPPVGDQLPQSVINYAARTLEPVLLDDASLPNRFSLAADGRNRKSLLCIPITKQGRLVGLLHLENDLLPGAFTADRVAFLGLLASQSAFSIENAILYSDLTLEVAERKRAEERLQIATRAADMGIWDWDVVKDELVWDDAMYALYGIRREDFGGAIDAWSHTIHPDDKARAESDTQAALRGERDYASEFRVIWPDGSIHHIKANALTFHNSDGRALRMVGTNLDITERKQAEEVLRQSEERMRLFFELQQVGMALTSPEKGWMLVNDLLCQMLGYSREELMGMTWSELTYPEDLEPDLLQFSRMLKGEIKNYSLEKRFVRKNGDLIYVNLSVACVRKNDGSLDYVLALLVDITERKRAEAALVKSRSMLMQAEKLGNAGGWEFDVDTLELSWTETVFAIHEVDPSCPPTLEQSIQFYTPESRPVIEQAVQRAIGQGEAFDVELEIITAKGNRRHVHAIGEADLAHRKVFGFFQDITERKQAEEEIQRLNAELEQRVRERTAELEAANKELESFSYSASHDLRAPLRAVDGFSHVLLEDCAPRLDEAGKDYLNRIRAETRRMGQLIDDMLMLSRVARTALQIQPVDLGELARRTLADLQASDPGRQVEVRVASPLLAEADPNLMGIALTNLLGNAWKFTSKTPRAWIEVGRLPTSGPHAPATFFVRDNGAGFDMAYAGKLFAAFQRLHRQEEFPGTGVGLATVARIIHRHGGEIRAEGAAGQGATFFFTLEKDALIPHNEFHTSKEQI